MTSTFLTATSPLVPLSASVAILLVEDGSYVVQHRDDKEHIWYPDHWGLFGGAIEPDESPNQALLRELQEELDIQFDNASLFTTFDFDFTQCGYSPMKRYFFEVKTTRQAIKSVSLNEGRECRIVDPIDFLDNYRVAPYDSFALWMHFRQQRLINSRVLPGLED